MNKMESLTPENLLLKNSEVKIKVYRKRWVILLIYILYSSLNAFQWMEYCIIENVIKKYYQVSSVQVDWTSIIYMAVYPVLVIPASYIIDKCGLRTAALIGAFGTAIGVIVKVFSVNPDYFYVVLIGQGIGSAAQVFILCLPSKIAAVWFAPNEISTACSFGIFGTQLGFALGFVVPSAIVKSANDIKTVEQNLNLLCGGLAAIMVPISFLVLYFFEKEPNYPPSTIQYEERQKPPKTFKVFLVSFGKLLNDRGFMYHLLAYGINVAVYSCIGTFLNQFVLHYIPDAENDVGLMGFTMAVVGMLGAIIFGYVLDKTHKYKESTLFIYFFCSLAMGLFHYSLENGDKRLVYLAISIVGFFTNAYMPVGFEFSVELTYPLDEGTTTGMLNAMTQGLGVIFTIVLGQISDIYGPFYVLLCETGLMFLGTLGTIFIPNDLKRQKALLHNKMILKRANISI